MAAASYETAKTNLRDNVKTTITMFGGVTGVLLAGTPFTGYAGLHRFHLNWWIATGALLVAVVLLSLAVRILLFILRPDPVDLDMLTGPAADRDTRAVQAAFDRQKRSLLPKAYGNGPPIKDIEDLIKAKEAAEGDYFEQADMPNADEARTKALKENYEAIQENLDTIVAWSGYALLRDRVTRGLDRVLWLGLFALLAIAIFVLASNSADKPETPSAPSVFLITSSAVSPVKPADPPKPRFVTFATGSDRLTGDAIARIEEVRHDLRTRPDTGVLIFANTDTMGGVRVNEGLAARRAERVAGLLRSSGGISPSRIFATPLAKKDLPSLTLDKTEKENNRAVEMMIIPLPPR